MARFLILTVTLFVAYNSAAPNSKHNIKIPKECKNTPFCTVRPEGYDEIEEQINKILSPHMIANVVDRIGPEFTETEINTDNCPSVRTSKSYYIIDQQSEVDIIVQTKLMRQTIEQVNCLYDEIDKMNPNQQCFGALGLKNLRMKSTCEETTATRSLFVFDPTLGRIREKNYTIPVCCSCKISNF